jgi:nucleoside-diphosphate-sugar epimerase
MANLVTGAAGFIGFHVTERLLVRGDVAVGLDNLNAYYDVSLKRRGSSGSPRASASITRDWISLPDRARPARSAESAPSTSSTWRRRRSCATC